MKKGIKWFIKKDFLVKTPFIQNLASKFIEKARLNLETMNILFDLQNNKEARNILNVPDDYDSNEWVVVCAYYAMYLASLAALAKVNYKSKNHTATVLALETFFVKKQLLENEYLKIIEKAQFKEQYIDNLKLARQKREIAQYNVTKETTQKLANEIRDDAYTFVDRMEKLVNEIGK